MIDVQVFAPTDLVGELYPVAAGAVLVDVGLEHGVLLRRPRPLLHRRLVAARRPAHLLRSPFAARASRPAAVESAELSGVARPLSEMASAVAQHCSSSLLQAAWLMP